MNAIFLEAELVGRTAQLEAINRALRQSETMFRQLADSMPQIVWTADESGSVQFLNRRWTEYTGLTTAGESGVRDRIHPDDALTMGRLWADARQHRGEFQYEFRMRPNAAGEYRWFLARAVPSFDEAGRVSGWYGTSTDIDDRKLAEERIGKLNEELESRVRERTAQLEDANRELEAFSYSVSHDLRAPLRAVNGFSKILIEDFGSYLPSAARVHLDDIRTGALQMGRLIEDLLSFSRLGRKPMHCDTVSMGELVGQCWAELGAQSEGNAVLELGELPACRGDRPLLKQVWFNLLSNARKYTSGREVPRVWVMAEQQSSETIYRVRDNGVGFDMRYAGKLFSVFHRLHRAEDYDGTGVGLAIVQRIVTRHGGRVWAEAEPERGAQFSFAIPDSGEMK